MEQEKKNQNQPAAQEPSVGDQIKVRREKLASLQAEGRNPFEITKFVQTTNSAEIKAHFDEMEGKPVSIAGRLMSKRGMGKVSFCDLQDKEGRIQLYARKDEMDEEEYNRFKKYDIGDIVGVEGEVFRTQRGEMSVRAKKITLLSKSLRPLPEKYHGLTDKEARYRQRYVDLIINPESKRNFEIRSKFVAYLRRYLDSIGFMEVETPVLSPIAGGDRFAFHEFKKRGDRIALGPAAGRRRHDGADRGLGIERPTADGPPDVAVGQDAADPVFVIEQKHGSKLALVQLAQGFRQEACFGKLRKALGPHDFADVELQALPQAASGMVAQEIFFRK